ncbi:hypothetical protein B0A52_03785 [Exophiala mesophila]|uniref:ABC transporter domain-containing protein n=1 Tax=Exophiala mesophila TaxID=212818 RepID=A0A438N766_EXOME|nr:hypothetical protein B0A52_03785 [Exophiala mesophila]
MTALPLTEKELSKDNQSKSELDEFTRDQVRSRPSRSYSHGSEGGSAISRIHSHLSRRQTQPIESDSEDEVDWRPDSVLGSSPVDRSLGLTWKNLTITGAAAGGTINENVSSQFFPPFLRKTKFATMSDKKIIHNSSGCVKPGEMMLVLGRPGAGCTSLLRVLGNRTKGFKGIEGQVMYGSLSSEQATQYRGQIVMDEDESTFFPTLTAQETIDFATRLNMLHDTPDGFRSPEQARRATAEFLFRMLNISHTKDTKVGNEYIRGVSGGERKRVGILEVIAAQGSVYLWDNSTRGLDASTALLYVKSIRKLTDLFGLTTIVTLYQAGNGIYDQFDKILVLENGEQIYYGPRESARPFFEDLGFICADGANVADFLTGVTVPTERRIRSGYESQFPKTGAEIRAQYEDSVIKKNMDAELDYPEVETTKERTANFTNMVQSNKHPGLFAKRAPYTVSFWSQLKASVIRQVQILKGNKTVLFVKQGTNIIQALSVGALFYNAPDNSTGTFLRNGALFTAIVFNVFLAQSEVTDSFVGRSVLTKHRSLAYHHPAAWCLAQIITDIPIVLIQITAFSFPVYFMVGLTNAADTFFKFWFILISVTFCLTAFFRAVGAGFKTFNDASKISGVAVLALLLYSGFMVPKTDMKPWIYWIDPIAYTLNAMLSNEMFSKVINCAGPNLVPAGPGYGSAENQACTGVIGATPGQVTVSGEQYLSALRYDHSHLWRNVGIVWVWWAFFVFLTILGTSAWQSVSSQNGVLAVPRELAKNARLPTDDEESQNPTCASTPVSSSSDGHLDEKKIHERLSENKAIFTWKNLNYTVSTPSGPRQLLDDIHGWVKPGQLGALMGSSGAGKTTLMDVLAQRKTDGTIHGAILVDGAPLPLNFQRSAGYCEQLDVHEPLATVREALEFSALLRQPRSTPREEKLAYVDVIIDLLEMHDIENCLVGHVGGAGLSVEQRKRLTIGVELVAKPSILTFLDEPTSGLDGQAAYNIIRFLKKLAAAGQAILVTIHQPSAQLFYEFDTLLLLAKGGRTVYFGDIGDHGATLKAYFARHNAPCPLGKNPAEHMIDVVSTRKKDWHQVWLESPEHDAMLSELGRIVSETKEHHPQNSIDDEEFATSLWTQIQLVTMRMTKSIYRNPEYVDNKFALHIITGLFTGFTFWQIGNSVSDLNLRMFAIFQFIFVAPGVINQLQPLFIERRDLYDVREKKSRMYSWKAFVTGLIISEMPYLVICAALYFFTFYYTAGFSSASSKAAPSFLMMLLYEFLYTGIGQFIAAYAPNATAAALANPVFTFTMVGYCGVFVPYEQIVDGLRYWLYWINPFTYLMGGLLLFPNWDIVIECSEKELAIFDPPANQTCAQYLEDYMTTPFGMASNLLNPDAQNGCQVCQYRSGSDWLRSLNTKDYYYGWRDIGIVAIFVCSSYALVYLMMKLRTKKSKKAE